MHGVVHGGGVGKHQDMHNLAVQWRVQGRQLEQPLLTSVTREQPGTCEELIRVELLAVLLSLRRAVHKRLHLTCLLIHGMPVRVRFIASTAH